MKVKHLAKSGLIFLLIFSMLLGTACGPKKTDDGEETTVATGDCTHTGTTLKNQVTATCKSEGYTGDRVCDACGLTVETGTVVAKGDHTWDNGSVTKQATCVETGIKTITCTTCFLTQTETVPLAPCATEHRFESDEMHKIVCAICYKSENGAHTKGELIRTVAATCTEGGYTLYSCSDCKGEYKVYDEAVSITGHVWDTENPVVTPATCRAEGSQYFVCKNPGCEAKTEPFTLAVAAGAHDYVLSNSSEATCTGEGYEEYECRICRDVVNKTLKKIPHTYGAATSSGNWTYQTCTVCNHEISTFHAVNEVTASIATKAIPSDKALVVSMKNAAIEFPVDVVNQMTAGNTVNIKADFVTAQVKDELMSGNAMSSEDKEALSRDNAKIYDFQVTMGNQSLHEFGDVVTVTLPYTLGEGEEADGIIIWYVAEDGTLTAIEDVRFMDEDGDGEGSVVFEAEHFSYYAVAYKETPEMKCRRGLHDLTNQKLHVTVEATCSFPGYISKTCQVCGHTVFDNYTEKTGHDFGEKLQPEVTCDEGGYVHQICANCGEIKKYEYIPSTGHKLVGHATCDTSAVCEICHKIVVPAYGHEWTEWEIVADSTASSTGLKRRNCPHCGEIETRTIAQKTDVSAWKFDSYQDLLESLVSDALGLDNGKVMLEMDAGGTVLTIDTTVCKEGESYLAEIRLTRTYRDESYTGVVYYRNGLILSSMDGETYVADVDMLGTTFPEFNETYDLIVRSLSGYDETLADSIDLLDKVFDAYVAGYEKELNQVLAERQSKYTAQELAALVDSLKTTYTYLALKMGVATDLAIDAGVALPTKQDWHRMLAAFTTKTETSAGVAYTYNASEALDTIDAVLDWIEQRNQKTLAEAAYDLLGKTVVTYQPSLTSWDACVSHVRGQYTGTTKFKVLVDQMVSFAEKSDSCTVSDLYSALGILLEAATGEKFDVESAAAEYGNKTMDELARMMLGEEATIADLYDSVEEYMESTKLGDMVVGYRASSDSPAPGGSGIVHVGGATITGTNVAKPAANAGGSGNVTLNDAVASTRDSIRNMALTGKLEIVLDANGNLVGLTFDVDGNDPSGSSNTSGCKVIVKKDSSARVVIPSELEGLSKTQVSARYDQNGNLILSGLPSGLDYTVGISGDVDLNVANYVEPDKTLTSSLGYNVYALKRAYWTDREYMSNYIKGPDGALYELDESYTRYIVKDKVKLSALMANPAAYLPGASDTPIGYCTVDGQRCNVYETVAGNVYKEGAVWMLIVGYDYYYENGDRVFYDVESAPFVSTFTNLQISNINVHYWQDSVYRDENGTDLGQEGELYYDVVGTDRNGSLKVLLAGDEIYLFADTEYDTTIYTVGNRVSGSLDYDQMVESNTHDDAIFQKDGKPVTGYTRVSTYKLIPSYYVEYDGNYFELEKDYYDGSEAYVLPFVSAYVADLSTRNLPDGRILYVVGERGSVDREGILFGYIKVSAGLYAQAACHYHNGKLERIDYRSSADSYSGIASKYHSFDADALVDNSTAVKKNSDGSYTVSAETVRFLRDNCILDGTASFLRIVGRNTTDTVCLEMMHTIAIKVPETLQEVTSESNNIYWRDWFSSIGRTEKVHPFSIKSTANGISLTLDNGKTVDVEFEFEIDEIDLESILTYDAIRSTQENLDIYTVSGYDRTWDYFAKIGNTYYETDYAYRINSYEKSSPTEILRNKASLGDLHYQFDMVMNGSNTGSRVYRTYLNVPHTADSHYMLSIFVTFQNGRIMALSGISDVSDVRIEFEKLVPLSDYIASLTLEEEDNYMSGDEYRLADGTLCSTVHFNIMDGDYDLGSFSCYYYMNGASRQYVFPTSVSSQYIPDKDRAVTLPAGWIELSAKAQSYVGESYTLVGGIYHYTDTRTFVRVGSTFVDYDYLRDVMYDEQDAMYSICDSQYVVGVKSRNGWEYYENWEWDWDNDPDRVLVYDRITVGSEDIIRHDDWIGYTADGREVRYVWLYAKSSLDTYDLGGGVTMYCPNGSTWGYAKLQNGMYVEGNLYETSDGYKYRHPWWHEDTVSSYYLTGALKLNQSIKLNGDTVTFSADILSKLEPYSDIVTVRIISWQDAGDYDTVDRVDFGEFASWFR